ncbi:hypothetical protein FA09DRAFT_335717 [Tilletiopsis washingtonensis]|uniref:Uncharacterized protein n=1 Tax=Tilletiopsis washingtonensis TaxID=58919 RepID=A0A316ZIZ8_9BASI|nr:hypothetical protein FA09DRAFT_335717 [Tilletiopsis washingtonensis]PWO01079.1 hypothetical protein FA09DRAFT_335717 [Tilletiopsis washingtonensis]
MLASLRLVSRATPSPLARNFTSSAMARSSGKGGQGMDQGPTETGTPGSASVDDIASSEGAYDGDKPHYAETQSADAPSRNLQKPGADMSKTAASSKPAEHAPAQNQPESKGQAPGSGPHGR